MINSMNRKIQQNFIIYNTIAASYLPAITVTLTDDFARSDSGLQTDTFNVAIPLSNRPNAALYDETAGYFNRKKSPMALWLWDHLPTWRAFLDKSPLTFAETNLGMFALPDTLKINDHMPDGFKIKTVQTSQDLLHFADVLAALFGRGPEALNVKRYYKALSQTNFYKDPAIKMYLGRKNGKPVSAGCIAVTDGSVGIYNIATLENQRNQGFGSAMFHHILADIRQNHNRLCVLQASPDGAGIYERAGFSAVCEIFVYENRGLLNKPNLSPRGETP